MMRCQRRIVGALILLATAGCGDIRFGFDSPNRSARQEVAAVPGSAAHQCFDHLAQADLRVRPDPVALAEVAAFGSMSEHAVRTQQRRRQREWDQHYCRRRAECQTLAEPEVAAAVIDDRVDACLADRSQRRVAMGL